MKRRRLFESRNELSLIGTESIATEPMSFNLFKQNLLAGTTIVYDLDRMLPKILNNFRVTSMDTFTGLKSFSIRKQNDAYVSIFLPQDTILSDIFSVNNFMANFEAAFRAPLVSTTMTHQTQTGCTISFNTPARNESGQTSLQTDEQLSTFRLLICLTFGFQFNLKIPHCACYPQNLKELLISDAGIHMNCIKSIECNTYLRMNPGSYDSIFVGPCPDNVTSIISIINAFSLGGSVNVNSIISQIMSATPK